MADDTHHFQSRKPSKTWAPGGCSKEHKLIKPLYLSSAAQTNISGAGGGIDLSTRARESHFETLRRNTNREPTNHTNPHESKF